MKRVLLLMLVVLIATSCKKSKSNCVDCKSMQFQCANIYCTVYQWHQVKDTSFCDQSESFKTDYIYRNSHNATSNDSTGKIQTTCQ